MKELKPTKRVKIPKRFICFDTEAEIFKNLDGELHTFKMGWCSYTYKNNKGEYSTNKYTFYDKSSELIDYVISKSAKKVDLWVIAHNIFYDLQLTGFFKYLTEQKWVRDFWYEKGLAYILRVSKDDRTIMFISSTNYFPFALKTLGGLLDLPKLFIDFNNADYKTLKIYCKRDTEILTLTMLNYIRFVSDNNLGSVRPTQASQALEAYRHRFMQQRLYMHDDEDVYAMEKKAYFGGRVECFFIGIIPESPVFTLDVNSMYPFVMSEYEYPTDMVNYQENPTINTVKEWSYLYLAVAHIEVETPEPCYGVRHGAKLIFPVGRFDCFVNTKGLNYAIEKKYLRKVHQIAYYRKGFMFNDYVSFFHDMKTEAKKRGDRVTEKQAKLFLNSLYGKFAQEIVIEEEIDGEKFPQYFRFSYTDLDENRNCTLTNLLNKATIQWGERVPEKTIMSIASHVTEYARFHLWEIIKKAGIDNVYYCDTDCVKVNKAGYDNLSNLIQPGVLGALDIEDKSRRCRIWGCKDYETENFIKLKGVPKSARRIDESTYEYMSFLKQIGHLKRQQDVGVIIKKIIKKLERKYTKGVVLKNGRVIPHVILK